MAASQFRLQSEDDMRSYKRITPSLWAWENPLSSLNSALPSLLPPWSVYSSIKIPYVPRGDLNASDGLRSSSGCLVNAVDTIYMDQYHFLSWSEHIDLHWIGSLVCISSIENLIHGRYDLLSAIDHEWLSAIYVKTPCGYWSHGILQVFSIA